MKIQIIFGLDATGPVIEWPKALGEFPKVIKHLSKNWEWFMYDPVANSDISWILRFSPIKSYDPRFSGNFPSLTDLIPARPDVCDCGGEEYAKKHNQPITHMFFCKKWRKQ